MHKCVCEGGRQSLKESKAWTLCVCVGEKDIRVRNKAILTYITFRKMTVRYFVPRIAGTE